MKQLRFVSAAIYHEISPDVPVLVYSPFDKNYHFPQRSICKILHNKGHKSVAFVSGWNSSHEAAPSSKLFNLKRPQNNAGSTRTTLVKIKRGRPIQTRHFMCASVCVCVFSHVQEQQCEDPWDLHCKVKYSFETVFSVTSRIVGIIRFVSRGFSISFCKLGLV